ncbi:AAA family ATPase [Mucilaginibacter paludis]|nr:AAA family ATPase [Mucilaginibacter paludis]
MKLERIEIKNFRGIEDATIELNDQLNLFVGINGSGKSTILDSIVISLSWLVARIQRQNAPGKPITLQSIKNDTPFSSITAKLIEAGNKFNWRIARVQSGSLLHEKSDLGEVSSLASFYIQEHDLQQSYPVIAYYPVNRIVGNATVDISGRESIASLDVYENALGGQTNYHAFFEWFRLQDDIANERANSRSKWMVSNSSWINKRIDKLLGYLDKLIPPENVDEAEYMKRRLKDRFRRLEPMYEDARYFLHELSDLFHFAIYRSKNEEGLGSAFREIDFMLHTMSKLSDSGKDDLIEFNDYPIGIIEEVLQQLFKLHEENEISKYRTQITHFIWEALLFSSQLSLWWLSDKARNEIETLFVKNNPARLRSGIVKNNTSEFMENLERIIKNDVERVQNAYRNQGRELFFVTRTIENFVPGYSNLRVRRVPRPHLLIDKDNESISLDQLSDGEKNLIAMVGDIARRLSMANPYSENPMAGKGIILIDEIDLHLHPGWQRLMIPKLTELFPNCQFIVTTHSPQVISHTKAESMFILRVEHNKVKFSKAIESYGLNTDRILEDILGVDARPLHEKKMIQSVYLNIQQGHIDEAQSIIKDLLKLIGEDPELLKAQTLIKRRAIIGK